MPPAWHNVHLALINISQLGPHLVSHLHWIISKSSSDSLIQEPQLGVGHGKDTGKQHKLCLIIETAFMLISATSVRAAPSGINDAGIILLPLILHHYKIPGELLAFPTPSSRIHVCMCVQARGELLTCLGLSCIHTTAERLSSKLGNFPAPHLPACCITAPHPLPPTLSPPLPTP